MNRFVATTLALVLMSAVVLSPGARSPALAGESPIVEKGVSIPLPGGGHLTADIVRPAQAPPRGGRFPTIYVHTCYGRRHVSSPAPDSPFHAELTAYDRYVYVATDWRGYPPPPGKPFDRSIHHGKDGAAAVEWIAKQPWSNGRVGLWGHSAVAGMAFKIMREEPEHLVCAVPSSGVDGLRYEQFFYGGVLEKQHWDIGTRVGHRWLEPLLSRATYDRFWRRLDQARQPTPTRVPVLLISGWYDTNPALKLAMLEELQEAYGKDAANVKLLIGPYSHTAFGKQEQGDVLFPTARGVTGSETLRFFDRHLRGEKNAWEERAPVRYFVMGRNEWREADRWPLRSVPMTLHLAPEGALSKEPPTESEELGWIHDPANPVPTTGGVSILELKWTKTKAGPLDLSPILDRPDILRFVTPVLTSELVVAGRANAILHIRSDQEDTDIALWLADVHPDGRVILVADGILRLSFRQSVSRPLTLTPGQVHQVAVELTPTAIAFQPGHRIMLVIGSSNYPRFDVNPQKARNTLRLGPDHASRLVVPILTTPGLPAKPTPARPGLHTFKIEAGGLERTYHVHVPPDGVGNTGIGKTPRAVVLIFHGGGGSASITREGTNWTEKADAEGFLAVFPEGTRPDPTRPARFAGNPQTWNDGSQRGGIGAVQRGIDDIAFVRRMIKDLESRFEIDRRRIYVTGFSNGASMTFRLGRELSSRFAAIAPVAGTDWTATTDPTSTDPTSTEPATTEPTTTEPAASPPALLYITGTVDPLNPLSGGEIRLGRKSYGNKPPVREMIRRWAQPDGGLVEEHVLSDRSGVRQVALGPEGGSEEVILVTVQGLGHYWPGGTSRLPRWIAGPNSDALDATSLIWEFFARHQRKDEPR